MQDSGLFHIAYAETLQVSPHPIIGIHTSEEQFVMVSERIEHLSPYQDAHAHNIMISATGVTTVWDPRMVQMPCRRQVQFGIAQSY